MKQTTIAWTNSTINLAWGCTKVSSGCRNCYMFRLSRQFGKDPENVQLMTAGKNQEIFNKKVKEAGKYIFINSMSDTFHSDISDFTREKWFYWMSQFPEKQFQILTKRYRSMYQYFLTHKCPSNCWLGVSVEDRPTAKERIPVLQRIDCKIRFISFEPLLGTVCDDNGYLDLSNIQWVIVGGESDHSSPRIMNLKHAEEIRIMCNSAHHNIPFFFKQVGGKGGDGAGGNILNGKVYQGMPA